MYNIKIDELKKNDERCKVHGVNDMTNEYTSHLCRMQEISRILHLKLSRAAPKTLHGQKTLGNKPALPSKSLGWTMATKEGILCSIPQSGFSLLCFQTHKNNRSVIHPGHTADCKPEFGPTDNGTCANLHLYFQHYHHQQ